MNQCNLVGILNFLIYYESYLFLCIFFFKILITYLNDSIKLSGLLYIYF